MKPLFILCICTLPVYSVSAQEASFRGARWGSSMNTIQTTEKCSLLTKVKGDELVYRDMMDGEECQVYYIFNGNDKLESGMYMFTKIFSNPQLHVDDYNKFKNLLIQKYGAPSSEKENWNSNYISTDKTNYGQAVADGNLSLNAIWNTCHSIIKITLVNDPGKHPSLQIHYTTASLDELEDPAELQKAMSKL